MARRTGTESELGARFDGEVDAFLIAALSVYLAPTVGWWVVAIGAARYVYLVGEWLVPWMRTPLPSRSWRKVVAATQGVTLTVAAADFLPLLLTQVVLVGALAMLAESFGRDVRWLWRHRDTTLSRATAIAAEDSAETGPRRGRVRTGLAVVLTILAALIVWAALVAPHQPKDVSAGAFARLPLEALVVLGIAILLPAAIRRPLAWIVGPVLGLLVLVKALDIGFYTAFDRPFNPVDDGSYTAIGIETLQASIGRTRANLVVAAIVLLVVVILTLTTLSVRRLTRVAAGHRRWSIPALAALGAVWVLCWVFGAQVVSGTSVASTSASSLAAHEVRAVRAGVQGHSVFAAEIAKDRFRFTRGDQLLTGLRGKDVLLVFVESFGKVAVQDSAFSPGVDAALDNGTRQLQAAGFDARTAWLTSPTFGGISWLAHSTMQSGVWVDSQRRYDQLTGGDRFTLSQAFKRAGWRTVSDVPSNDRAWPPGTDFYHYDQLYDRRNVGYQGPTFGYASMPDQYVFDALPAARARQAGPAADLRRDRPGVEPHAVDQDPPADRLERRRRRLDLQHQPARPDRRQLERPRHRPDGVRPVDRVHHEHPGLLGAALQRPQPRAGGPRRPPALDDRHRKRRQPRRADLDHRPRPEGARSDLRLGLGGRPSPEPARAGVRRWTTSATASSARSAAERSSAGRPLSRPTAGGRACARRGAPSSPGSGRSRRTGARRSAPARRR